MPTWKSTTVKYSRDPDPSFTHTPSTMPITPLTSHPDHYFKLFTHTAHISHFQGDTNTTSPTQRRHSIFHKTNQQNAAATHSPTHMRHAGRGHTRGCHTHAHMHTCGQPCGRAARGQRYKDIRIRNHAGSGPGHVGADRRAQTDARPAGRPGGRALEDAHRAGLGQGDQHQRGYTSEVTALTALRQSGHISGAYM